MDGNQNGFNNVGTIYCAHCGALNYRTNNNCVNCGTPLIGIQHPIQTLPTQNQPVVNNVNPPQKENKLLMPLMIILGIATVVLCFYFNSYIAWGLATIAALTSVFFKKTRAYGIAVLISFAAIIAIGVILIIILFGMCFAALGSLS